MATLIAQQIIQAGLKPTTVIPTVGGDKLANTGIQFFHVINSGIVAMTASVIPIVTTVIDPLFGALTKENAILSLEASEEGYLGPFEVGAFNDVNGDITIICSVQTNIKLSALYI